MKVLLRIPLSPFSGYGNDGIGLARALMRWGADVYLDPVVVQAPLPPDIAMLLTKSLQSPFDMTIVHLDPAQMSITEEQKRVTEFAVGWTMWEYSNFGNLPGRSKVKANTKNFDAILAYDQVTADCYKPYFSKPTVVLQGGYNPEDWPRMPERDWHSDRFGFCMVGQLHERKDPFVAIQAFQELKTDPDVEFEGAELHLKTNVPGLHSAMEQVIPKLRIHYAVWPTEIMQKFYEAQHVLLAPSRGEGKNMPALEMQSTGGTVIATNWGGHQQWLDSSINFALDYQLAPLGPDAPNTYNARASVDHLKELMLYAYTHRAEVERMGNLAAQMIPKMCSWDSVVEKMFLRLRQVDGGERLWNKAQACRQEIRND